MNSDILFFFGEHMDALPLYERLEDQILTQIPEVKIKVAKTQITFANKRGFAFVSFNPCRKAKNRPEIWMTITFGLGYRIDSPSVDFAATSPTARGKKSTFTGKEAHSHGHEVHREQRGFCPSAP